MAGGLANSRHAPPSLRQQQPRNGVAAAHLTVTPAPTGRADGTHAPHNRSTNPSPATPATSNGPADSAAHPPSPGHHELARYAKIMRRLQWKLPFLAQGYRLAVDRLGADPAAVCEAELMFKLDFFEYYMLIERALVHLLGVFGIDVPRRGGGPHPPPLQHSDKENKTGLAASRWRDGRHRYHANVLAALESVDNPLHGALGTGEVRAQLARAKDLRNRWKTAGDDLGDDEQQQRQQQYADRDRRSRSPAKRGASQEARRTSKLAAPLDSYRLEHMLEVIFRGFDEAFLIAQAHVRGGFRWSDEDDQDMMEVVDWAATGGEDQWEFMVDAMDWEAV